MSIGEGRLERTQSALLQSAERPPRTSRMLEHRSDADPPAVHQTADAAEDLGIRAVSELDVVAVQSPVAAGLWINRVVKLVQILR